MSQHNGQQQLPEKKAYVRPQLARHGVVETLTQGPVSNNPSCPINVG